MDIAYLALLMFIALVAGGSHAGICVGIAVGMGSVRKRIALMLYAISSLIGMIVLTQYMERAVMAPSLCTVSTTASIVSLSIVTGLPLSLNLALYSSQIGCECRFETLEILIPMVCSWIALIAASIILAWLFTKLVEVLLLRIRNVVKGLVLSEAITLILSVLLSVAIGGNTFGYLYQFALAKHMGVVELTMIVLTLIISMALLSEQSIKTVAFSFYGIKPRNAIACNAVCFIIVAVATFLGIPAPASLILSSAIVGSGLASSVRMIRVSDYIKYLAIQLASIPLALVLGMAISFVMQ